MDFYARTLQIRSIMAAIEAAARAPGILSTNRVGIDLSLVGAETGNTANAMAFVYLASSYEEFIREEVGQCADFLMVRYPALEEQVRHKVRNLYWQGCITALDKRKSILAAGVGKNKQINGMALSDVQNTIESVRGFVVLDDSTTLQRAIFYQHSRNFKPDVVDQIGARIGVTGLIDRAADSNRLRAHFGVATKSPIQKLLSNTSML